MNTLFSSPGKRRLRDEAFHLYGDTLRLLSRQKRSPGPAELCRELLSLVAIVHPLTDIHTPLDARGLYTELRRVRRRFCFLQRELPRRQPVVPVATLQEMLEFTRLGLQQSSRLREAKAESFTAVSRAVKELQELERTPSPDDPSWVIAVEDAKKHVGERRQALARIRKRYTEVLFLGPHFEEAQD